MGLKNEQLSDNNFHEKISFKEKTAYGLGDFATAFGGVTVGSFALYYYTDVIGVSAATIGAVLFFSRIFDAITNVIMGYLVDRTNSKHGKARAWILWSTVPFGLLLIMAFNAPSSWGDMSLLIFAIVILNLYFLAYTASNIPYGTLAALMTQDSMERSSLNTFRMIGYNIGGLLIPLVTLPLVNSFGGGTVGWRITISIYAVLLIVTFFITFFFTKERVKPVQNIEKSQKVSLKKALKALFTNKYWLLIFGIMLLAFSILGLVTGVNVYYAKVILGDENLVGSLNFLFTLPLLISLCLTPSVIRKIGRRKTIAIGLLLLILGSSIMIIDTSNIMLVYLGSIIRGIGFAPIMGNSYAMLADTIDYGEWKTGIRNDGLVYSGGSFSAILGSGIASGGIGWILGLGGYVGGVNTEQPESVFTIVESLFIYSPIVISLLMLLLLKFHDLDNIHSQVVKDLHNRAKIKI
ncbi:MFS transporter [Oceanobacillus sojae]|uniref:MFS transporter n=1 Tax=Oceanobacillus sojae TaxID=582851 RepID=UPI0021A7BFC4|nr:glycoside-pentoside-hexuronide (GPH):cation symporter [Oceanobacillus sojae]MCT1905242.1 glycoside-pentoside-hexuronide (GPH):cation symporter [Oceanobacillus sojae]